MHGMTAPFSSYRSYLEYALRVIECGNNSHKIARKLPPIANASSDSAENVNCPDGVSQADSAGGGDDDGSDDDGDPDRRPSPSFHSHNLPRPPAWSNSSCGSSNSPNSTPPVPTKERRRPTARDRRRDWMSFVFVLLTLALSVLFAVLGHIDLAKVALLVTAPAAISAFRT